MNLRIVIAALLALSLGVGTVPAYADQGIPWHSLSQGEQTVLRKHQSTWPGKSPGEQTRLLQAARKYLELPADKRKAVEHKRDQYQRMSPAEREQLRKQYSKQKKQH
jgi:hypothetical protein